MGERAVNTTASTSLRSLTMDELAELQRQNMEWLRPCTPEQQRTHEESLMNASDLREAK